MYTLIFNSRMHVAIKAMLAVVLTAAIAYASVEFLFPYIQARYFDGAAV